MSQISWSKVSIGLVIAFILVVGVVSGFQAGPEPITDSDNSGPHSVLGMVSNRGENNEQVFSVRHISSSFSKDITLRLKNEFTDDMDVTISLSSQPSNFSVSMSSETVTVSGGSTKTVTKTFDFSNIPSSVAGGRIIDSFEIELDGDWTSDGTNYDVGYLDYPVHLVDYKASEITVQRYENFSSGTIPSEFSFYHYINDDDYKINFNQSVVDNPYRRDNYSLELEANAGSSTGNGIAGCFSYSFGTVSDGYFFVSALYDSGQAGELGYSSGVYDDASRKKTVQSNGVLVSSNYNWEQVGYILNNSSTVNVENCVTAWTGDGYAQYNYLYVDEVIVLEYTG